MVELNSGAMGPADGTAPADDELSAVAEPAAAGSGGLDLAGSGSGALDLAAAGSGGLEPAGSGTGALDLAGSGGGALGPAGSGSGGLDLTGSGSGGPDPAGSGSGALDLAAAGSGGLDLAGSGSGALDLAGSGSGGLDLAGSGSGALDLAGAGAASVPVPRPVLDSPHQWGIGPVEPPWPDVRRIAVLRGGGLGDLLFTLPAIEALAAAYPAAEITLLGLPAFAALLADRPTPVHRVVTLPPARGVHEPRDEHPDPAAAITTFREQVGADLDLGVQLHGGGRFSNPFLLGLGPKRTVGARTPDAVPLTRWLPYRYYQHEVLRALEVVGLAGAPPVRLAPRIVVTDRDRDEAAAALRGLPRPLLVLHPGATDPRRRWPAERYAEVAATFADRGAGVVVVGSPGERDVVEAVVNGHPGVRPLTDLTMSGLCGVLAEAGVLLANDSGPRHLAEAVGTPTVGLYWLGNAINAGSFGRFGNRVLLSWTVACPVCGVDCTRTDIPRCEHDVSFVADIPVTDVVPEVEDLL